MSLPPRLIRASARLATSHKPAFVYAPGLSLPGGDERLVCVWDGEPDGFTSIPAGNAVGDDVPVEHVSLERFTSELDGLADGEGWSSLDAPVRRVAGFAYGVMLSDRSGAGTKARGAVSLFPWRLTDVSRTSLAAEAPEVTNELSSCTDGWQRAHLLDAALHRAYVAWFAAHQRYWPGRERRYAWVSHFELPETVADYERGIWDTSGALGQAELYAGFVDRVLAE
ncbi:hypothetical protein Afil01_68930 [Actinorhabdospora filicis]|uniref:Uncharacterized protein n=1 Tax=Actinorhabdospora filicis TaxID=1785913 RepID=A0A9W6WDZ1_9ACTN|nr:hypothetical protein [Actinorhabdospora filicis]GLZ82086.1 hypothetical protein Afil01_68930 [Actinorhabdospora filicis]